MTSIQERLQKKRIAVDVWSVREQLCLASAVKCSGDQNWMSVSRSLKSILGNSNRPEDWFQSKNCAIQYCKLLDNVENPKRKKRTASERDSSGGTVETPVESLVRKLTSDRIVELKKVIPEEQSALIKLKEEIKMLESGAMDDNTIREMWAQIEQEKKQAEREQLAYQQWLKEREEKKQEMTLLWKFNVNKSPATPPNIKKEREDMEVDEPKTPQTPLTPQTPILQHTPLQQHQLQNQIQQQQQQASQAAPTISMLLDRKPLIMQTSNESMTSSLPMNSQYPDITSPGMKDEDDQQLIADLNDLIPVNIDDELENINDIILNDDLEEESDINFGEFGCLIGDGAKPDTKDIPKIQNDMGPDHSSFPFGMSQDIQEVQKDPIPEIQISQVSAPVEDVKPVLNQDIPMETMNFDEAPKNEITSPNEETVLAPNNDVTIKAEILDEVCGQDQESQENLKGDNNVAMDETNEESNPPEIPSPAADTQIVQDEKPPIIKIEISDSDDSNKETFEEKSNESPAIKEEDLPKSEESQKQTEEDKGTAEKPVESEEEIFLDAKENLDESGDKASPAKLPNPTLVAIKEEEIGSGAKSTTDSDDDALIVMVKEDKLGKIKRDYSRRKYEADIKKEKEDMETPVNKPVSLNLRTTRNRDRSESPLVDDDTSDTPLRTRRRYSSTPVTDSSSVPNSPASTDDKDYKLWKKSILIAYSRICAHKSASVFLRPPNEEQHPGYKNVVYRPMDLQTIKKSIENGNIRTTEQFTRDVLLMCANMMMYAKKQSTLYKSAVEMMNDAILTIESAMENVKTTVSYSSASSTSSKDNEKPVVKRGNRKSMRNT